MRTIPFLKKKYGRELLMDLGTYQSIPNYFFKAEVHRTDFFEIVFFEHVKGTAIIQQKEIELVPNSVLFISPYQKRQWFVNTQSMNAYFLAFQEDFLNAYFSDKLFVYRLQYFFNYEVKPHLIIPQNFNDQLKSIFTEIFREINDYQSDSHHIIRSLLYFILTKLNRAFASCYNLSSETQLNNIAYRFKLALEENITQLQKVDEYAELLKTSRISLNNATKKQFNTTISAMIKNRLLFECKDLLLFSDLSISEIAYRLNFSESANFKPILQKAHPNHTFRVSI